MNTYKLQLKLDTMAHCAADKYTYDRFEFKDIFFSHWDFNLAEGHKRGGWLISGEVEADSFQDASKEFVKKLNEIIPKISFLSQCYTEYLEVPFLIHKLNSDIAYFYYSKASSGVGLHFDDDSLEALNIIYNRQDIFIEFYYYWNDMLNTTGYSAKLLLICSALEALAKSLINKEVGKDRKYQFLINVLGKELKDKIFAQNTGIRHRLIHGEYFSAETDNENYLNQIYQKIIDYFNIEILEKNLIRNVVEPQRHPYGNKEVCGLYLRKEDSKQEFDLKQLIDKCYEQSITDGIKHFKSLSSDEVAELGY